MNPTLLRSPRQPLLWGYALVLLAALWRYLPEFEAGAVRANIWWVLGYLSSDPGFTETLNFLIHFNTPGLEHPRFFSTLPYWGIYQIFGVQFAWYPLANLVAHLANAWALRQIVLFRTGNQLNAFFAFSLVLLSFFAFDLVTWSWLLYFLLSTTLFLYAILLQVYYEDTAKLRYLLGQAVLLYLQFFVQDSAVNFLPLFLAYGLLVQRRLAAVLVYFFTWQAAVLTLAWLVVDHPFKWDSTVLSSGLLVPVFHYLKINLGLLFGITGATPYELGVLGFYPTFEFFTLSNLLRLLGAVILLAATGYFLIRALVHRSKSAQLGWFVLILCGLSVLLRMHAQMPPTGFEASEPVASFFLWDHYFSAILLILVWALTPLPSAAGGKLFVGCVVVLFLSGHQANLEVYRDFRAPFIQEATLGIEAIREELKEAGTYSKKTMIQTYLERWKNGKVYYIEPQKRFILNTNKFEPFDWDAVLKTSEN